MARPLSISKKLKEIVRNFLQDFMGGKEGERKGKPGITPVELTKLTQLGRTRAERPTRELDGFAYVQDLLANMPAAVAGLRQLAEDVTLDENGDARAWNLSVKVDSLSENPTDAEKAKLKEFKKTLQIIFDDYALRTGIGYNAKHYVFKFLTAGDCFAEQVISLDNSTGLGRIERIRELPTWQMHVIWDESGELAAYEQRRFPAPFRHTKQGGDDVVRWEVPAQIIHWKYHSTDYIPYGQTVFSHLRGRWEQFKLVELDTIATIHTKSVDPEVHKLGRPDGMDRVSDDEIKKYKQELLDNPTDINRFYVIREGEATIELPKGREGSAVEALVNVHRDFENRFVEALGIPGHISGNVKDVAGRHISASLDSKHARRVSSVRADFTNFLLPSIALEFALHGIDLNNPEQYGAKNIVLSISWPNLMESPTQRAKRIILEWTVGAISHESALRQMGYKDPEGEVNQLMQEREAGDLPLANIMAKEAQEAQISANNEQGKGVPTSGEDESSGQGESAKIIQSLMMDPEDFRQIIREELETILSR